MEQKFLNGLIFKDKKPTAPDFVKGSLSIKREELINTLQSMSEEWINLDLKVSKEGKSYAEINTWKPDAQPMEGIPQSQDDGLPF